MLHFLLAFVNIHLSIYMNPFFDAIIILYLLASGVLGIALWRDRKRQGTWEARHPISARCFSVILFFSFLVVFWGSFIEPRLLTVKRLALDLPNFEPAQPVRLALISDVHVGTYKKAGWVRRVSRRILQERPNLVLLAGDFIVSQSQHAQYLAAFRPLSVSVPTYAVLGDHDYHVNAPAFQLDPQLALAVEEQLTSAGVQVLKNAARRIATNGASFWLLGLDDWLAGKTNFINATSQASNFFNPQLPAVVLVHNPDFILGPEAKKADLILAGNTHGGQIRLPFLGPVARLPSQLPRRFDKGLFTLENGTRLFITSGISESGPRARLFNPPEIVLLELK